MNKTFMKQLADAYKAQDSDPEFQREISVWDTTVSDGLDEIAELPLPTHFPNLPTTHLFPIASEFA